MSTHIQGPLYHERMGATGPVMVFLHPIPMDQSSWIYQMAHFSTWFRCVAIDLPGFGRSPKADIGLTMEDLAQSCWAGIDDGAPDTPAILVGCSAGSRIIPYMYQQRPETTIAAVLSGTGYSEEPTSRAGRIRSYNEEGVGFRWLHNFVDFSAAFRATPMAHYFTEMFVERNPLADADSIVRLFQAMESADPKLVLGLLCPTIILSGTEDASHTQALELRTRMPHAEFRAIPGAGHACFIEQPSLFDRYVLEFLERKGLLPLSSPCRPSWVRRSG
jgi:pimeloyl-ACP methyl ester carboxylesterase